MIRTLFCLLFLLPVSALAQTYPALHDVTGVAANDVLNIRAEPSGSAGKIGALAHNATNVEVIRTSGSWGLVTAGERSGWVSMRYLARQPDGDYALTRTLACYGTEPFWNLSITQGTRATFTAMGGDPVQIPVGLLQRSANRTDRFVLRGGAMTAIIARAACSDGMSDREFGLTIDLLSDARGTLYSGCCSLTGN
ncbi:COG3650 family protein [Marimonas lutisalis]|uniref:COG3650 family protein n=1 Tax=Marimonas lutisalis TaxID=2545756 RepID=UPI0010F433E6|nr:SH3 domain-containing protein [Marimonas lutisalis]